MAGQFGVSGVGTCRGLFIPWSRVLLGPPGEEDAIQHQVGVKGEWQLGVPRLAGQDSGIPQRKVGPKMPLCRPGPGRQTPVIAGPVLF